MKHKKNVKLTLYGSYAKKSKIIGFCKFHRKSLTSKQLKEKECLSKNCKHLVKYKNHDFWISRDKDKVKKSNKKKSKKLMTDYMFYKMTNKRISALTLNGKDVFKDKDGLFKD